MNNLHNYCESCFNKASNTNEKITKIFTICELSNSILENLITVINFCEHVTNNNSCYYKSQHILFKNKRKNGRRHLNLKIRYEELKITYFNCNYKRLGHYSISVLHDVIVYQKVIYFNNVKDTIIKTIEEMLSEIKHDVLIKLPFAYAKLLNFQRMPVVIPGCETKIIHENYCIVSPQLNINVKPAVHK